MTIQFQPAALAGSIALALGFTSSVHAAEQTVAQAKLDTIVVTASRSEQNIKDVPARISVIDEKTIQQSAIADLPSLLNKEAALSVKQLGGYGQQTSVFLRGSNPAHTLILQDGMRSNIATVSGTNLHLFDLTDIKQIEVLKGPASVQYGTDAIGGVIQLISKTPTQNGAFTTIEVGEKSTYKSIVGIDAAENDYYAQIRGQRFETNGDQIIQNEPRKASYDQKGYSAKLGVEKEKYAVSAEIKENKGTSDYFSFGELKTYDFLNRLYNIKTRLNLTDQLIWNVRLSQFDDQYNVIKGSYPSIVNTEQQEIDSNLKWQLTSQQSLLFGAQYNNTKAEKIAAYEFDEGFNSNDETIGYYLQHQFKNDRIATQAGIRVEDDQHFGTHTVGQAAARYFATENTSIYTNIGTAFQAPIVGQIITQPSWWGGNPDLKPEESISYELGFDHFITSALQVYGSIYQTKVDNLLISDANTNWTFENIGNATFNGAELGLKWKQDNLFANAEYAYMQPKNDDTDKDLINRPRQNFNVTLGWDNGKYGASTSLVAKGKAKDTREVPGYAVIDMNAYWQVNPHLKTFVNIRNLGDTNYKTAVNDATSYYIASDRLASAGVTFKY
ncbi:TonB-dependent receptor plug domain-containing protein [Acinetobacter schindleri]|uniref:TonB-dependent receptor plug domain-containing protein n=1 Tax=Acinetobacter schindleri TaxID=108981 RepID=UPI000972B09A|nr:TonB-dependent receptor [Acinetobacter schindleri]APX63664.1 outer membrane cobalamin receptor protein [Acinetobacter schindleri]